MIAIDISFQINSPATFPADHSYALVGAISRLIPEAHGGNGYALAPIAGRQIGGRLMKLTSSSRFVVRTSPDRIPQFLPLAGKTIDVLGRKLHLGVPTILPLIQVSSLRSRLVTIKGFFDPTLFANAVRRQLDSLGVGECEITVGQQRTLRIKAIEVVGFETTLHRLQEADSLIVAANGVGGRKHMGCGFFIPVNTSIDPEGEKDGENK